MSTLPGLGVARIAAREQKRCTPCHLPLSFQRYQSTYRRSRSRLNVKPDPAFLPSTTEQHDHIIYNPPSSAPNVYHTPTIFLPRTDKRRQLHQLAIRSDSKSAVTSPTSTQELPPVLGKSSQKRYHLTAEDMDEMRRLRTEDPLTWSSNKLAKKFGCSSIFVGFVTEGIVKEKIRVQKQVIEAVKSSWGVKRRTAREDRSLRKERWGRDG